MKVFRALLTLVLFAAIAVGAYFVIRFCMRRLSAIFDTLDPKTGIILGASGLVVLLCAWLISAAIRAVGRREIRGRLHGQRARIYQIIIQALAAKLHGGSAADRKDANALFFAAQTALFLRGGVAVNNEYRELMRAFDDARDGDKVDRDQLNDFLLSLRRDCGQMTSGMDDADWPDLLIDMD